MTLPSLAPGAAAAFLASVLFLKFRRRTEAPAAPPKPASPPKVAPPKVVPPKAAPPKAPPPKAAPPAASGKPAAKPPPKPAPKAAVARVAMPKVAEPPAPDLANVWSELDDLVTSEPAEQPEPPAQAWAREDADLSELDDELLAPPQARGRDRIDELLEELQRTQPQKIVVRPRLVPKKPAKRT